MTPLIAVKKPALEIAHILQKHLEDYKRQYRLKPEHSKILSDLLNCRTAKLGGRVERCDTCGSLRIAYHSCRNRHCPKCQHMPRERWLAKRQEEILPVNYFHVVFTLPHELNAVILNHKRLMLNCLFAAASQTLLRFGQNELGGSLGFLAVLHTWDQKLKAHFHLHCLVAGGVVADNGQRWIALKTNYLFNQRALSLVFRGKFMQLLHRACQTQKLTCDPQWYQSLKHTLFAKNWVVSVRDPVKDPQQVLDYLARYTHRVAIANSRIQSLQDGMVTFTAKNRKKNRTEPITISAVKFIRRFLLHSLPTGLVRIRHYGFLANRNRQAHLSAVRALLGLAPASHTPPACLEELMSQLTGVDITTCPCCHRGHMHLLFEIPNYWARANPPAGLRRLADRSHPPALKATAELRPDDEKYRKWKMALPSNTAQLVFMTLSMIPKRLWDNLKKRLYERLWFLRSVTIPIKNNLANTSARRLRTSPFYQ